MRKILRSHKVPVPSSLTPDEVEDLAAVATTILAAASPGMGAAFLQTVTLCSPMTSKGVMSGFVQLAEAIFLIPRGLLLALAALLAGAITNCVVLLDRCLAVPPTEADSISRMEGGGDDGSVVGGGGGEGGGSRVRALYGFASVGPGEMSLGVGEVVVVMREDVGDGWWMGRNARGEEGLFPVDYVEVVEGEGEQVTAM